MNESLKTALKLVALLLVGSVIGFGPTVISVTQNAQKVQTALAAEEYPVGARYLLELAEYNPWWTSLWESAGRAAFLAGDYSLAQEAYLGAYQRGDLSEEGQVNLGTSYLYLGDPEEAERTWLELSGSPSAMRELGDLYESEGNISRAIEFWSHYLTLLEENPEPGELYYFGLLIAADSPPKALVYLDQSSAEYPEAGKVAERIRDSIQEEPAYQLLSAGQALASDDQWRLASFAFEKAVALRPDYPEAWFYWGESLQHIENPEDDPGEILQNGLSLDEDSPLGNLFMGLYWQRKGSHAAALDFFAVVESQWPDRADVLVEEGKSLAALGELEAAYLKYQEAIELYPQDPDYYRMLAEFCLVYAFQIKEAALPAGRWAAQFGPQDPANIDVLGQVLLALEDEMNALRLYQQALALDPSYAPAYYHLGILFSARDEADPAVYYLNQTVAYSKNPALTDQAQRLLSSY
jgi:tetratricopeptide (TPR) repeat protein